MRHLTFTFCSIVLLITASTARAQPGAPLGPQTPEDTGAGAEEIPPADQPPPAETAPPPAYAPPPADQPAPAEAEPAADTATEDEGEDVDSENLADLSHLHVSGYVQPELRYEHSADDDMLYFQLRRGRVKFKYEIDPAFFLLQTDATQDGVSLKDAYGGLHLPMPEGMEMDVIAGLFKIPFGFDMQYSSSHRVFPERAQMVRQLFPGERDLGVRLDASLLDDMIGVQLAVQNGVPLGDEFFGAFAEADGDNYKDATLHVTVSPMDELTVGVSGLYGVGTRLGAEVDDPMTPDDETATFDFSRYAVGGELRYTRELGSLGTFDLYGELTYAHNLARKSFAAYPANADANVNVLAWYAAVVQDLGDLFAVGLRFDQFAVQDADTGNRLTVVGMTFPAGGTRLSLAWDFDLEDTANHEGWLRMQVKF